MARLVIQDMKVKMNYPQEGKIGWRDPSAGPGHTCEFYMEIDSRGAYFHSCGHSDENVYLRTMMDKLQDRGVMGKPSSV